MEEDPPAQTPHGPQEGGGEQEAADKDAHGGAPRGGQDEFDDLTQDGRSRHPARGSNKPWEGVS
jgi:hypothetical protein